MQVATVGKSTADRIAELNGRYDDDPPVVRIVEYTDMGGNQAYGLEYEGQLGKYAESVYVRNPKVYWQPRNE